MSGALRIPELLAPAGSRDALRAAIANGADAVYLGTDRFNARRGAENFTLESLPDVTRQAHLAGVRVYLTLNVLIQQAEMAEALRVADAAWAAGVDAVIVQDVGLLSVMRHSLPHVRVHASTQIDTHNAPTLETLAELGVSRVTLARELSIAEIRDLSATAERLGIEAESFVHGALCVCYSGQCLLSSMIGGRSANRGACAQPCRLPYTLEGEHGSLETPGVHLLSPRDLAGIEVLPDLVASGAHALKIEGRAKSAEYVALVTGVYRAALDRLAEDPGEFEVRSAERAVLAEAFSRGFSTAYLTGERGNDMMSYRRPNNRGVPVGRVVAAQGRTATVSLDTSIESGDTVEIWTSAGRVTQRVGPMQVSGHPEAAAPVGARASFEVDGRVAPGDRVFRVANAALLAAARRTFEAQADHEALAVRVRLVRGEPIEVEVRDTAGRTGVACGPVVEAARTKAVTADEVVEHVGRLGGTRYEADSWDLELTPGVGVAFSALHRARRDAIAAYEANVLAPWATRTLAGAQPRRIPVGVRQALTPVRLVVSTDDIAHARIALDQGADEAHVSARAYADGGVEGLVPVVPRILHDAEVSGVVRRIAGAPRVVVANLGMVRSTSEHAQVEAHWSLNVVNAWAAATLADLGATFAWASPELAGKQLAQLASSSPIELGTAVWGRQELMVTEHCILMAEGSCDRRCASCGRRRSVRVLKDRKGYEFPVTTDTNGRSHLFNSVPLDLSRVLDEVLATGVRAVRIDLSVEGSSQVGGIVRRWRTLLDEARAGQTVGVAEHPSTTGHFFRGVS